MSAQYRIAPSIFAADFARLGEEVRAVIEGGADLSMLKDSFMSRPNTIVAPGGKMELAMQLIFTPMIWKLMDIKRRTI